MKNPLLLLGPCLLIACSGGGSDAAPTGDAGEGFLTLEITDKPLTHDLVVEAPLVIDRIRIHGDEAADEGEGGWLELDVIDGGITLDLVELRDGLTRLLVDGLRLPAGAYGQMRLHVASGHLLLVNDDMFTTLDGSLQLTSQGTSGFKVKFDPPLLVRRDVEERYLLDVDLTKTYKPVPGNDPLGANKYHLHPVLRVINRTNTGDVLGKVVDEGVGVQNATIYLLEQGVVDLEQALASTGSGPDGRFALMGLLPGIYDLVATHAQLRGELDGVQVFANQPTTVEVELD